MLWTHYHKRREQIRSLQPAEFSCVTCSLAPSPHTHRHKNTPLHHSPLKDRGEPALLLKASNHVDTFLNHGFWSAECYLIVRKPVNRSYWFLKETFHSHTVQVTLLWCKKTIKQKTTTTKQTRLSFFNIFSTYPGLPPCHCSLSSDTWVCWWRKNTHITPHSWGIWNSKVVEGHKEETKVIFYKLTTRKLE